MQSLQDSGGGMADLIPVHQEHGQFWADARTLHAALQVGRDFSNWIRSRLDETGAIEGEEFIVLDGSPVLVNGFNPKPRRDYWLSLDLAKEVAMLERSDVGKQIRRYFIQAEKQLRAHVLTLPDFTDPVVAARAWADAQEGRMLEAQARELAEQRAAELEPQAQQFQALMSADGTYSVSEAAKILGTGEGRLFRLLRERGILMDGARSGVEHHNVPYQQYLDAGYFQIVTRPRPDGKRVTYTTRVTAKGLAWLQRKMAQQQLLPARPGQLAQAVNA